MPRSQLHGQINVSGAGVSAVHHGHGLREKRHQQPVHDESGRVSARDGLLADLVSKGDNVVHNLLVRVRGRDHLHQLHDLHGVEEMQTHELVRSSRRQGHVGDGQGRGVGSEDATGLDQRSQLLVEIDLDVFTLNNGLDDQVAVVGICDIGGGADAAYRVVELLLGLFRSGLSILDSSGAHFEERIFDSLHAQVECFGLRFNGQHLVSCSSCHLCHTMSHETQSDDAHFLK
mmetsp:Transcript_57776/g.118238  ORF Transcript_57776/g.118238 Transcript_57776/m.118238 type:complete len:231 (-) Transcript_57776:102-794(-)